ncbi:MAG TPA: glycosyltransferase [Candidatus Eisenbacteria bacterium]|jgi:glycosyltransferase involved in cell wall biosynthesis
MAEGRLRILQVGTADLGGGAESVAWALFQAYRRLGHGSWLAVGWKHSEEPGVSAIPNRERRRSGWAWASRTLGQSLGPLAPHWRAAARARHVLERIAEPRQLGDWLRGREDFHFPGTQVVLDLPPERPDILHAHNLHGRYFDLRALPWLGDQVPIVLTLHDMWSFTGHCAHSFGCERWRQGCGHCPDLTIYPAIRRDATAENWIRKRDIYARSRLRVATPSRWLLEKVKDSMLAPAIVEARVIPNGVDLEVFRPGDRAATRRALGLPAEAAVVLSVAFELSVNPWKDYATLRRAVALLAGRLKGRSLCFVNLGDPRPAETIPGVEVRFVPPRRDPAEVARYFQAADLYLHAARAETFPNTVIEALACGTPVVATAVGGVVEQVEGWADGGGEPERNVHGSSEATGVLVAPGDAEAMAEAAFRLLDRRDCIQQLGANAAWEARRRFDLAAQVQTYLAWYAEILAPASAARAGL